MAPCASIMRSGLKTKTQAGRSLHMGAELMRLKRMYLRPSQSACSPSIITANACKLKLGQRRQWTPVTQIGRLMKLQHLTADPEDLARHQGTPWEPQQQSSALTFWGINCHVPAVCPECCQAV